MRIAHDQTQRDEGTWLGEVKAEDNPATAELVRRFNAAMGSSDLRVCPHLGEDADQTRFWVDAVPEFLACKDCCAVLAVEEKKRGNTCCILCGDHVELRGFSIAVDGNLLRAGVCSKCEADHDLLAA